LVTNSSGATAPSTTFPHQWWLDTSTTPSTLRQRNADNDAWIVIGLLNQATSTFNLPVAQGGTGAATLTANNVLLGNGTSAVQAVAPGTSGNVLTSNGTTWESAAPTGGSSSVDVQTFNSSGTWTKPSFGSMARIQVWSAGGGGGRTGTNASICGGAGGGYCEIVTPLSSLGATETITIGAGGAGRTGSNGNGTDGGSSSFGSSVTVLGGQGGINDVGGSGGTALPERAGLMHTVQQFNGGDSARYGALIIPGRRSSIYGGGSGGGGGAQASNSHLGGFSVFGGKGGDPNENGFSPGGGGSAASTTNANGFNGADGRVIVTVW